MHTTEFLLIVLIGFLAQLIDGSLGMAYGVSSTTFLTSVGIPVKIASASVHTAEVFTTFVSGLSHWKMKNVDWAVFKKLVFPRRYRRSSRCICSGQLSRWLDFPFCKCISSDYGDCCTFPRDSRCSKDTDKGQ